MKKFLVLNVTSADGDEFITLDSKKFEEAIVGCFDFEVFLDDLMHQADFKCTLEVVPDEVLAEAIKNDTESYYSEEEPDPLTSISIEVAKEMDELYKYSF